MKLYYYHDRDGNFGDDLNPWFWRALAPELLDDDDSTVLVGIGTLINSKAPRRSRKIVFGAGVGYHSLPAIDASWQFHCVRGPRSARRLGLDPALAISDPALLLTLIAGPAPEHDGCVSYMPHHASLRNADWRNLCERAGVRYLDPGGDVQQTVASIRASGLVIAEAMHAAIVADAFRVPWIAVSCYDHILDFKWHDWCESLRMRYDPLQLPRLWDGDYMAARAGVSGRIKRKLRRGLEVFGVPPATEAPVPNSTHMEETVVRALASIAGHGRASLSRDSDHLLARDRLQESLDRLRRTFHPGPATASANSHNHQW